jgi:hypothetical protein
MPNHPLSVLILVSRCSLASSRLSRSPSSQQSTLGKIVAMPLIPLLLQQKKSWTGMPHGIIQSNSGSPFTSVAPLGNTHISQRSARRCAEHHRGCRSKGQFHRKNAQTIIYPSRPKCKEANSEFRSCGSNTFLEIRFSSLELSSQGQFSNSPIAYRPSRGSSRDL